MGCGEFETPTPPRHWLSACLLGWGWLNTGTERSMVAVNGLDAGESDAAAVLSLGNERGLGCSRLNTDTGWLMAREATLDVGEFSAPAVISLAGANPLGWDKFSAGTVT
jgi:hypothetical protein